MQLKTLDPDVAADTTVRDVSPGGDLEIEASVSGSTIFQRPTITVVSNDGEIRPTEATVETNRYSQAAVAKVKGIWDGDGIKPNSGEGIFININGVRVFSGKISKSAANDPLTVEIEARDLVKKLKREKITKEYQTIDLATVPEDVGGEIGEPVQTDIDAPACYGLEYDNTPVTQVLGQVAKLGKVSWWVDEYNILHVESPKITLHQFSDDFVEEEPTAGEDEPPYQKVIAKGNSPAGKEGLPSAHKFAKDPIIGTAGEGKPVYTYESQKINTQWFADAVAEEILREFAHQRAKGKVTVIGVGAPIRPFDAIEMPDSLNNERYLVSGVKHTFNNDDGLITDINCGGLIDGE